MKCKFTFKAWLIEEMLFDDRLPYGGSYSHAGQKVIDHFEGNIEEAMLEAEKLIATGQFNCMSLKIIRQIDVLHHELVIAATVNNDNSLDWIYPCQDREPVEAKIKALEMEASEALRSDSFSTFRDCQYQAEILRFQFSKYYKYAPCKLPIQGKWLRMLLNAMPLPA